MALDYKLNTLAAEELALEFETKTANEIIEWFVSTFRSSGALVTSFQVEGQVILDLAQQIDPSIRVITIDTGRLPEETYSLIDKVRDRYNIDVEVIFPNQKDLQELTENHGINPFYRSVALRLACCNIRKVLPMEQALKNLNGWMTGIRRNQSGTRADVKKIEIDYKHEQKIKINPLADWTQSQVWTYIKDKEIPYSDLYDRGYTSIGCAPCTRPTDGNEDPRAGRWWWEQGVPKECGIHVTVDGVNAIKDIDLEGKPKKS